MSRIIFFILIVLTSGCASLNLRHAESIQELPSWIQQVKSYQQSLAITHPHRIDSLFSLSDSMRETVRNKFGSLPRSVAVKRLANWLVDTDGHAMVYDVDANFPPIQAFQRRRGNCLSFTMLLSSLANELGIVVQYNEVDLPNTWSFEQDKSFVLYRHVNGIYKSARGETIFDLAMQDYDFSYPQRLISKELAAAKLLSNIGIAELGRDDYQSAEHYLKLAVSMGPDSSDLWVNYGVLLKRQGFLAKAEDAFIHSFRLNRTNSTAASNLERLYNAAGKTSLAARYKRVAKRLRQTNPYYHFNLAQNFYDEGLLGRARRSIQRAKKLYNVDPRFYELSSRLYQRENNFALAFDDLRKAHSLAVDARTRGLYAMKALRLNQLAAESVNRR